MKILCSLLALGIACSVTAWAEESSKPESPESAEVAYTRAITERADKIVATLGITNAAKATLVRDLIAQQYRNLRDIHAARDTQINAAKEQAKDDKTATESGVKAARDEAKVKQDKLHADFLSKLSAELTPEQVDKVKDGLTYGVREVTYNAYLKQYPGLTEEHKKQITAWLVEAREIAMDGGSSNEKHAVFGKYKGRINNYLSKAGYDLKTGRKKPAETKPATNAEAKKEKIIQ
jgi:Spy/CpxP family protein refolding chaperone